MSSMLSLLFRHRFRPNDWRARIRWWGKRFFSLPELLTQSQRVLRLRLLGARVGLLAHVGILKVQGRYSNLRVGNATVIGDVFFATHGRVTIGDYSIVNDGVCVLTASHDVSSSDFASVVKDIVIGDYAWVAMNSTILPGVHIGDGAVIGAGSVVVRDVAPYTVVAGAPARVVGARTHELSYVPAAWCAGYEAWVGREIPRGRLFNE